MKTVTIDSLGLTLIDILKIDVEGAEPLVLVGTTSMIKRKVVRHIVFEWNPSLWKEYSELVEELDNAYEVFECRYTSMKVLRHTSLRNVVKFGLHDAHDVYLRLKAP
ncbi:MAG: FkbM family methyltransferase [Nitrososphaerota archaeon]|nr:FkbM family methyltransferase [Nitrososphaerota archaeon]MDG6980875.1 FkbM family methyltransferase [Nitrososphaerota archaeon]MDG6987424.1 FkbM family methyltransferase [Nitrososphaerota archaeon]